MKIRSITGGVCILTMMFVARVAQPDMASEPVKIGDMSGIPAPVAKQMRTLEISPRDVSFYVRNTASAKPLLSYNADVPRNPASSIKLLTTAAGLGILGPRYRWTTRVYATGKVAKGRLNGDLFVKGSGDPTFRMGDLWHLLWSVRARGIETIGGDLILDSSYFGPTEGSRDGVDGKSTSAYNALPHALSINLQETRIHLALDQPTQKVHVFTDPPLANLEIHNELRLVAAPCKRKHHKPVIRVDEQPGRAVLRVTGTFADGCGESSYGRLLLNPAEHTAGAALALWRAMQGKVGGSVREGSVPKGARLLHRQESEPLEDAIREINKHSNNLMTRTLFLTLGAQREGVPGTLQKARKAVGGWLAERGLGFPELIIDNGSGLSRATRISAASMGRLLADAYMAPTMPQFLASLSVAGVDGTMRKRFKRSPLKGRAYIKTGTLRGATAIAGYLFDPTGGRWIVVSLINNPRLQAWRGKGVENTLLQWVYDQAGSKTKATHTLPTALPGD